MVNQYSSLLGVIVTGAVGKPCLLGSLPLCPASLPALRSTLESRRVPSRSLEMAQHAKLPEFDCHWGMGNRTDSSKLSRPPLACYAICDTHTRIIHHTQHMSTNNNMIYFKTVKKNFAKEIKQAFPY